MKHFIFEDKDYDINPEYKIPHKKHALVAGLGCLYYLSKKSKGSSSSSGNFSQKTMDKRQNCTAKMYYSFSKAAHLEQLNKYLKREGTGKDGKETKLYGTNEQEYRKNMVSKNFRIFLSPQNDTIPLGVLAKTFINRLELQTGYQFYYQVAEHYNTSHPHIHILINGKDKLGQDVFMPPEVVKTYMREISRDICTSLIGERTPEQIKMEKLKLLESTRFTKIDQNILKLLNNNILEFKHVKKNAILKQRLDNLVKIGFCTFKNNSYIFEKNWDTTLQQASKYNTFLDARNNLRFTSKYNCKIFTQEDKKQYGVITKIYRLQEDSDSHAVLLEGINGNAYFIPLFYKPQKIKRGDLLQVSLEKNQKGRLNPNFERITVNELTKLCKENNFEIGFAQKLTSLQTKSKGQSTYLEYE